MPSRWAIVSVSFAYQSCIGAGSLKLKMEEESVSEAIGWSAWAGGRAGGRGERK